MKVSRNAALLAVIFASILLSGNSTNALPQYCKVLSFSSPVVISNSNGVLQSSVQIGDFITHEDILNVPEGGFLQLSFDEKNENVVHLSSSGQLNIDARRIPMINMERGELHALIDNSKNVGRIEVFTDAGIVTARDSYFKVELNNENINTSTFKGSSRFFLRNEELPVLGKSYSVKAGEALSAKKGSRRILKLPNIKKEEFDQFNSVIDQLPGERDYVDYAEVTELLESSRNNIFNTQVVDFDPNDPKIDRTFSNKDLTNIIRSEREAISSNGLKDNVIKPAYNQNPDANNSNASPSQNDESRENAMKELIDLLTQEDKVLI